MKILYLVLSAFNYRPCVGTRDDICDGLTSIMNDALDYMLGLIEDAAYYIADWISDILLDLFQKILDLLPESFMETFEKGASYWADANLIVPMDIFAICAGGFITVRIGISVYGYIRSLFP